jgi:subtilase family serine protease
MQGFRRYAALFSVGLLTTGLAVVGGAAAANAATSDTTANSATLNTPSSASASSFAPAAARAHATGAVAASTSVSFDLDLALSDATGAQNIVRAVSDPASASYHHYLTDAQWEASYGPSQNEVAKAEHWLSKHGFSVGAVPSDRLFVPATGTAAQVEKAFGTTLGYYKVNGQQVRMAETPPTIPTAVSGVVSGLVGLNEYLATTDLTVDSGNSPATTTEQTSGEPGPPAGYRNPKPCSSYWGQKTDTADSASLYAPYTSPLPYDICGYTPSQLRSAYGLTASTAAGDNGSGVAIAIVDAYDSPTLLSDAQEYFTLNDPTDPLSSSKFFNDEPSSVDDQAECGGSGWYDEQSLDVEASHTMAPGADILFVGAQDCTDTGLLDAFTTAVTSGASIVSDSWGDTLGDLLDDAATKTAYDDTFMLADATGVSVLFSAGDGGDNFAAAGLAAPDYPPASPFVTAVGGTAVEVGQSGNRLNEYGWSAGTQELCARATTTCGKATTPIGTLGYDAGGGGGTSYYYTEPYYQDAVVPAALTLRNQAIFGPTPLRVEPDISMDADAQTGFLIGLTQTYGAKTKYGQFKEGGTSLASPLLAGVIADTDQAAGASLGFLNPTLYKAYSSSPTAFNDIVPPTNPDSAAVVRVNFANGITPSGGYDVFLRALDYEGPETYCDGTGNCATRDVTLTTAPGFDSMTGLGSIGSNFIAKLSKY